MTRRLAGVNSSVYDKIMRMRYSLGELDLYELIYLSGFNTVYLLPASQFHKTPTPTPHYLT